jgi:hypothetical protein
MKANRPIIAQNAHSGVSPIMALPAAPGVRNAPLGARIDQQD